MEFIENLNIEGGICPPAAAFSGKTVVYRLVDTIPVQTSDFWSYRKIQPAKHFGVSECQARSCSVFIDYNEAKQLLKIAKFREKRIILINIKESDGVMVQTPSRTLKSHHSWWISRAFDITRSGVREICDEA
jgi:hypothetical protein